MKTSVSAAEKNINDETSILNLLFSSNLCSVCDMTLANQITIARILMIPFFVLLAVYYGDSVRKSDPQEWMRWAAIGIFFIASVSDGLDGYIARRRNQRTKLGAILDPLADKGLLITALITLTVSGWRHYLPLWFLILILARESLILLGSFLIHFLRGAIDIVPSFIGKSATVAQMIAIGWIMLQFPYSLFIIIIAGILTLISGIDYIIKGIQYINTSPSSHV